jgi:hypothetical protein
MATVIGFSDCQSCGGELAMTLFALNFPSSTVTGLLMNEIQAANPSVWQISLPYALMGCIQWISLGALWSRFRRK